jgi:hypothetical protein
MNSFILYSVFRHVRSPFLSDFSTEYGLWLPLSIYSILLFSLNLSSSYIRLLCRLSFTYLPSFVFFLITCFRRQFLRKIYKTSSTFFFVWYSSPVDCLNIINIWNFLPHYGGFHCHCWYMIDIFHFRRLRIQHTYWHIKHYLGDQFRRSDMGALGGDGKHNSSW